MILFFVISRNVAFVPARLVAKNCVRKEKFRTRADGSTETPAARARASRGNDAACAFAAIRRRLLHYNPVGRSADPRTADPEGPLFRLRAANGRGAGSIAPISTAELSHYAKHLAARLPAELDVAEAEVSAHSFRIGGATDLADAGGTEQQLRARGPEGRGRWDSDVSRMYASARATP